MPIHCPIQIRALSDEEFEERDYRVMGHAFVSQNELGRLCDERVYEADVLARLLADGFRAVHTQVPVTLSHRDFAKRYFLDLIADDALYELKTAAALTGEDDAQLIHYILLTGVRRGKLLNLRTSKVQGRLLATSLTHDIRRQFREDTTRWHPVSSECKQLRETLLALLADWGAFLDFNLYQEALIHFVGGEERVAKRLPLRRNAIELADQRFLVHASGVAFRITALTEGTQAQESNLRRLLALTELKAIQWVNLNHSEVQFVTLLRDDKGMGTRE